MDRKKKNERNQQLNNGGTDERNGMLQKKNPDKKPGRIKQPAIEKEALIINEKGRKL
ncbi:MULTISPECIES: hypothetical protein [Olivibacter]|jgi:hypothetical protein|uniref:Uncharacterized protein n=2 Tax=Olivibacter TaxID=376469 RepID=A0ABV6HKU5_9SPHI|nr:MULTISPECIES: hypothetical protein [Olivibacter]MDM8175549.1 hypothetical protein [Olivibacter sp. 47]MDX3914158.1 hypothetical protein [Pseudosphingobacterium sp.]